MTCAGCWYWSEGSKANDSGKDTGECRRKSPATTGFPQTKYDDWCGDFTSSGFMPRLIPPRCVLAATQAIDLGRSEL
jgi:hypothetical protein